MAGREEESKDQARPPNHLIQNEEGMTMEEAVFSGMGREKIEDRGAYRF